MRWYSVSVFSNFEKKVAESIKEMVEQKNLENEVSEVLVPHEEVLEIRRGEKSSKRTKVHAWVRSREDGHERGSISRN